jgi:hypothetical protein
LLYQVADHVQLGVWFDPLMFYEVMAHGLKYYELSVFYSFLVPLTGFAAGFAVSDSYKSNFSFDLLQLFLIEYTTGRGLGVSYNTPGMLV